MTSALGAAELQPPPVFFEQRLFAASPFGVAATTALVFAFAAGSFLLTAALVHYPLVGTDGLPIARNLAPGIATSLLLATALGMQRYADLKQRGEASELAALVSSRAMDAAIQRPPAAGRTLAVSVVGAVAGAAINFASVPIVVLAAYPAIYAWKLVFITTLGMLFGRGVLATWRSGRTLRVVVERGLRIELLHTDRLAVIGRQSARNSLVWFTVVAIMCLYFVGGNTDVTTLPILMVCAGLGLWIFLHPMMRIHQLIRLAKEAELDRVRDEIGQAAALERGDPAAAARLPGLIAYEARIQAVREWPFDHSTLVRVGAYVLIPAIPWFGQAVVSELLQRLAH